MKNSYPFLLVPGGQFQKHPTFPWTYHRSEDWSVSDWPPFRRATPEESALCDRILTLEKRIELVRGIVGTPVQGVTG